MTITTERNPGAPSSRAEQHLLGARLVAEKLITEEQLSNALERQKTQGFS
jgi:hypothetical protein